MQNMKPIAIFRFAVAEGPGYLAEFLDARHVPWQLIKVDAGEAVPRSASEFSGLVLMGGPMSVNDELPWIKQLLGLIRDAVAQDIPVLGHCLGGQLISKALGGVVAPNPVKEIGWGEVAVANNEAARVWFPGVSNFSAFHWHGETFSLPAGATRLLSGRHCANQAYAIGKHLALQCHIEMTADMVQSWCAIGAEEISASQNSPAVQSVTDMRQSMIANIPQLQKIAGQVYAKWLRSALD